MQIHEPDKITGKAEVALNGHSIRGWLHKNELPEYHIDIGNCVQPILILIAESRITDYGLQPRELTDLLPPGDLMKKNAIIFGAGQICSIIKQTLFDKFNVVAIVDNNKNKWNGTFDGVAISNPAIIGELQYDVIIIASNHNVEIARQLRSFGVPVAKMEVGANYVFQRMFDAKENVISYSLDNDCNLVCKDTKSNADIIDVRMFQNKRLLIDTRAIAVLIGLFDDNNHLPDFFCLSERHHGFQTGAFLDIGAHIGTTSIQATEFTNVNAVISFEPSSEAYALLMANVYLNKLENRITAFRHSVGAKKASHKLRPSSVISGDNRIREEDHTIDFQRSQGDADTTPSEIVSTIVIDDFLRKELDGIKYVWIDVQGYEYFVLKGCEALLKKDNISVQIEYWPHGLMETNSLDLLNRYLMENFTGYVDMDEYSELGGVVHDIRDVSFLAEKLRRVNSNLSTDLFLLK